MTMFTGTAADEQITTKVVSTSVISVPIGAKPGPGGDVVYAAGGRDYVYTAGGNDVIYGGKGNDDLRGGNGNDTIFGGSAEASGGDADDRDDAYGGMGNDAVYGGEDQDYLYGDEGNDRLYGGAGNDCLFGGSGQDALYGGNGDDVFVFPWDGESAAGAYRDVVAFEAADVGAAEGDQLSIMSALVVGLTFVGTKAFSGLNQVRVMDGAFDRTIVQVNRTGDKAPEMEIAVADGSAKAADWIADDFIL